MDDIEDFLRRAAERRQAKASQSPAPASKPKPAPEYTDARAERMPRKRDEEPAPIQAILVEEHNEPLADHLAQVKRQRQVVAAKADKRRAGGSVKPMTPPVTAAPASSRAASPPLQKPAGQRLGSSQTQSASRSPGTAADGLIELLKRPEGIAQAFLLQEILRRPTERW